MLGFGKKNNNQKDDQVSITAALDDRDEPGNRDDTDALKESEARHKQAAHTKKGKMDKLIMGAILGVAVGSVVGAAVNSRQVKETGQTNPQPEPKNKKGLLRMILGILFKGKKGASKKHEPFKKIPNEHS